MGLLGGSKGKRIKEEKKRAGLFIFGGVMQYIELTRTNDGFNLDKCFDVAYDVGGGGEDLFPNVTVVENNLKNLKKLVGKKWPNRVIAGIQSKDAILRTVELTQMSLEDIKSAFRFEFDRFFPIPVDDAVYDMAFIDRPAQEETEGGEKKAYCLASAVRRVAVENFMTAAQHVGMKLAAIEPAPIAMLRCLTGPVPPTGFNVYALAGMASSIIVSTYRDNGIVFRNTGQAFATSDGDGEMASDFARDLAATVNFSATQMRGFAPDKVYIGGYGASLGDTMCKSVADTVSAPVEIVDPWSLWKIKGSPSAIFGWEVTLGLALRPAGVM